MLLPDKTIGIYSQIFLYCDAGATALLQAHFVKDRRCNTAKAVLALDSLYKWALSGTPLQNRVGELYSLVSIIILAIYQIILNFIASLIIFLISFGQIRFLQIVPYSYYLCNDCDCRTLDYRYALSRSVYEFLLAAYWG